MRTFEQKQKPAQQAKSASSVLSDSFITSPDDTSIPVQAARLTNVHFQTAQRQAMANQIGRVGGNRYLQKVIAQIGQEEREKNYLEPKSSLKQLNRMNCPFLKICYTPQCHL